MMHLCDILLSFAFSQPTDVMKIRFFLLLALIALPVSAQNAVIRAGTVIHAENGTTSSDQKITVSDGKIASIESWSGRMTDNVIDLSDSFVMAGMIDAHAHMALEVDPLKDGGNYFFTGILNTTPYRAVQGVRNSKDMLEAGFTSIRDIGNNGNYADVAIKQGIDEGLVPGPHMEVSGRIIAPFGAQFHLQPEKRNIGEPEYFFADGEVEVMKAVRENLHFGATFIKLVIDDQSYIYSVDEIRAAVREAEVAGTYVAAHCWTDQGARNAIEGGVHTIEHGPNMSDDTLQMAKDAGVYLVGTEFTLAGLAWADPSADISAFQPEHDMFVDRLRRAYAIGVTNVYGSDAVFRNAEDGRGIESLDVLSSWREAGVANDYTLRAITATAAEMMGIADTRGILAPGLAADIIAMPDNPLDDTSALHGVNWVMQNGKLVRHP